MNFHATNDVRGTCRLLMKFRDTMRQMYEQGTQLEGVRMQDLDQLQPNKICPVVVEVGVEEVEEVEEAEETEETEETDAAEEAEKAEEADEAEAAEKGSQGCTI